MITLKINDKNYKIPESWNEISIDKFIKLQNISPDVDDVEKIIKIVSVLANISEDILNDIPVKEVHKLGDIIQYLMYSMDEKNITFEKTINGKVYRLDKNIQDYSARQFIDLDFYLKEQSLNNLHKIMGILYRPIVNDKIIAYKNEEHLERAELFKTEMDIVTANSAFFFFTIFILKYLETTQDFLEKKMM
jgi:hypothetical protein